ncbi:hypothetical protein G4B88_016663 [Cannabis sativa]|uniref:Uncharacterized protein n=2 Tax=Cannabis sativa TaxID=3483 RepID=A0A7J6H7U2_CANSA|nr:hypothetical protein G4B88_016663 [Cannabis sativa]
MAETAVGLVIDNLIPLLAEEAYLLSGVHNDVEEIRCDLDYIMAFLKDADVKAQTHQSMDNSNGVKVWVGKLRRAAFEVEDVIDEYTQLVAQQQGRHKHKFIGFLRRNACLVIKLKERHDIASKIQGIKQKIRSINEKSKEFGFMSTVTEESTSVNVWYDPRKHSRFLKETEIVGIKDSRDKLIQKVKAGSSGRIVISVVGMGGLGKTTLANQVYIRSKDNFDCHAWIEVSQTYKTVELLQKLMKKFCEARKETCPDGIDTTDETTMITKLRGYLQGKSYLVIFDDVWHTSFWDDMRSAFSGDNERNGRVVITTRNVEVANFCKASSNVHIHNLKPLPSEKAWELFCNKAFRNEFDGHCPRHLEKLSREIVDRCQGLPLAVVVIAGLLSTKPKVADDWKKLLTSLSSELESNEHLTSIAKILSLSYNDLPYYLKCCFLYVGYFPEDYSFRSGRIIRQWIAEGFVKSKRDKTLEVIAQEYLIELINRNLIQVSETYITGKAKTCRIHDLLRDIIMKKMEELDFCQVLSGNDSNCRILSRRMSVVNGRYDSIQNSASELAQVRSLFVFGEEGLPHNVVSAISINFKLLKVLDFEDAPNLDHLPKNIGSLFHLKYLSIRETKVAELPKSIGKLEHLETLDLKRSLVVELPIEIKKLKKLRHLFVVQFELNKDGLFSFDTIKGAKVKKGIGQLKALQKLYYIQVNVVGFNIFEELKKLTELRTLCITMLRSEDNKEFCDCVQKMSHLESLSVISITENEIIDLESISSPPQYLQRLTLEGRLRKLPKWITKLNNIVKIQLVWSKLEDDPLNVLQSLYNLLNLGLSLDGYCGEKLQFEKGGFPNLKKLELFSLSKLSLIVIEEEALCNLETLEIGYCPQLKEVSCGFQQLTNLKNVNLMELPTTFMVLQNFNIFQSAGAHIEHFSRVDGKWQWWQCEWLTPIFESIRGLELDWDSIPFENIMREIIKYKNVSLVVAEISKWLPRLPPNSAGREGYSLIS